MWAVRALYALLGRAPGWWFRALCGALGVALVLWFSFSNVVGQLSLAAVFLIGLLEPVRLTVQGWHQGRRGIGFVALGFAGALGSLLFAAGLRIYYYYHHIADSAIVLDNLVQLLLTLSPALGISLFLAYEFALDARLLQAKLGEVEHLSAQTLRQEQEKQALLATQNDTLEQQVAARTAEVLAQRNSLARALTELRATQGQLIQREKMASLGELTAGIAHEIQNPLNFVNNFAEVSAELLADLKAELAGGSPAEAQALADDLTTNLLKIKDHGGRASGIVRGMLEHSRTSTGERAPTDVNALCDEYLRLAYHGLRAKDKSFNATLETDFAPSLPVVEAVAGDLGRVLLNLLTNAFYAVQQRQLAGADPGYAPTVSVRTRQLDGRVQVEVRDNGSGIPEAIRPKVFQPFFTTKPAGEGTGLGLSLSYDIITQGHGGTLTVESEANAGTTFTLQLPLAAPGQP
ncbi:two-component sensor histidine kinase [Hymenobacter sp. RP-2-7]|uniref:histidine kinase n=1 Tax=Hymenobacter polaris TaxID=2682546 RepID=A0A7Y0AG69_9BACT|nr:two-component sensor histidine kinase [Hymenobacter polaris]